MGKETEVKARLRVDDAQAKPALDRTKKGFQDAGGAAREAQGDAMGFIRSVAAQAIAFNAANMIGEIRGTAMSFIDAAAGAQEARKSMAATAVVLENVPWKYATERARENQAELGKLGREAGFTGAEVAAAYNAILESTNGSTEAVARTKEELAGTAKIAEVFDMNLESAGREIAMMHEGTLRTRGQMFQLLRSTGIFGSDVHKAAEGWAKLTDEQRTQLLTRGLASVGDKLKDLPPTYHRLIGQVGAVFDGIKKDVGEPLVEALTPILEGVVAKLGTLRGEIRGLAKQMGPEVAHWIHEAAVRLEEGLHYLEAHGKEIKDAVVEGFTFAKDVVTWILAHKEEIALIYGGAKAYQAGKALGNSALPGAVSAVGGAATGLGKEMGYSGLAATASGLTLLAVAAAATATAFYAVQKAVDEHAGATEGQANNKANIEQLATQGHAGKIKELLDNMRAMDEAGDDAAHSIGDDAWILRELGLTADTSIGMTRDAFDQWAKSMVANAELVDQATQQLEAQAQEGAVGGMFEQVVAAYNTAQQNGNVAAQQFAASMLVQSGFTAETIKASGLEIAGGLDEFTNLFSNASGMLKDALAQFMGGGKGSATAKSPMINMSGGQSFHINQDFRNEDPDNIAVVFERDVGRLVQRRIGASTGTAFGG